MTVCRWARAAGGMVLAALTGACAPAGPGLTPQQWAAIETRELDAPAAAVIPAAAAVLLDKGFVVTMSDADAGLLGAESMGRHAQYAEHYARSGGLGSAARFGDTAVLWIRPLSPTRSEIRVQIHRQGWHSSESGEVADIWTRTQRRLMAGEPVEGG